VDANKSHTDADDGQTFMAKNGVLSSIVSRPVRTTVPDALGERDKVSAISEGVRDAVYSEDSTHDDVGTEDGFLPSHFISRWRLTRASSHLDKITRQHLVDLRRCSSDHDRLAHGPPLASQCSCTRRRNFAVVPWNVHIRSKISHDARAAPSHDIRRPCLLWPVVDLLTAYRRQAARDPAGS